MSKYIALLLIAITPLCAESIDEMKKRFMDEIEACSEYRPTNNAHLNVKLRCECQLKITNKLMLLFLIEQMKESKK